MPKPRILFVEDEDYIARVIKSSLEDAGYEVFRANSLVQGRVEAATRSPELLILDLGLPDGDGTDLIRTLRSYSSVPIIILSARSGDDAKVEALDLGADDYISKPFSMMELLARVRAHLRRAAGDGCRNAVFTFGDVTVDQARGVVLKGKDEVHLTKLEFRLLCVLIAGRGRVLTHRQLLADVWGAAYVERPHYLRLSAIIAEKWASLPKMTGVSYFLASSSSSKRNESEPSFKVNTTMNSWFDFGMGKGRDYAKMRAYVSNSIRIAVVFAVVITFLSCIFCGKIKIGMSHHLGNAFH